MRVGALAVYPLKGARAVALPALELDALGPAGDRRYCLARPGGLVFTQRDDANLARVQAHATPAVLQLALDGAELEVPVDAFAAAAAVRVWSRDAAVRIAPAAVNAELTRWFGTPLELVRLERPVQRQGLSLALGDAAALLLANAASLDALNAALAHPVPMDRFRPNVVLEDAPAYDEDRWGRLRIGGAYADIVLLYVAWLGLRYGRLRVADER